MSSPARLAARAAALGQDSLALNDFSTVTGLPGFIAACDANAIRPILGAEIPHQPQFPMLAPEEIPGYVLPTLVAQEAGWQCLVSLLNQSWFDYRRETPAMRFNGLNQAAPGLFFMTGMAGTELHALLGAGYLDEAEVHLRHLQNVIPPGWLLVALEDHGLPRQQAIWRRLHALAKDFGIPAVATCGVTHSSPEEQPAADFLANAAPPAVFDMPALRAQSGPSLVAASEIHARFANRMPVIEATLRVADACDWRPAARNRVPCPPLPRGLDPMSALVERAFAGLGPIAETSKDPEALKQRLRDEIEDARAANMVEPLLILNELARFCHAHLIPTGIGSGRLVSSLLAYCLGLTRINPVQHSLVYTPWPLTACGGPLLTIEVPWRHAGRIAATVQTVYGEEFQTYVGQWDDEPVEAMARHLRAWIGSNREEAARDLLYFEHFLKAPEAPPEHHLGETPSLPIDTPEVLALLLTRLHPRPGPMGISAGTIAISSESLRLLCPTVTTRTGRVSQLDRQALRDLGLALLQIRANPMLDIIDDVTRWIHENGHPDFSLDLIPEDDRDTYDAIAAARTAANAPLCSTSARLLIAQQRPRNIGELRRLLIQMNAGREYPVFQSVADATTAYRLAFLTAHFPGPFYAAALTAACGQAHQFRAIAAEARSAGFPILPPDISTSAYSFTPARNGILAGLVVVRSMTREAWAEIARIRDGGPITGLREFANRVSAKVPRQLLANLVHAGCFDHCAPSRAHLVIDLDQILREIHDAITPSPERLGEITPAELLHRELEATDHLLGGDSGKMFGRVWSAARSRLPDRVAQRHAGRRITVHGRVIGLEEAPAALEAPDSLAVSIEGLIAIVPKIHLRHFENCLHSELPVLAMGVVRGRPSGLVLDQASFYHPSKMLWAEEHIDTVHLSFSRPPSILQATTLLKMARFHRGGRTCLSIHAPGAPATVSGILSLASGGTVFPTPPLIEYFRDILPDTAIRFDCKPGVSFEAAWRLVADPARKRAGGSSAVEWAEPSGPAPIGESGSGEWILPGR